LCYTTELMESLLNFPLSGQTLSLATAFIWAIAVILFRISGKTVHPLGLNLYKSILATFLFIITIVILKEPLFPPVPFKYYCLLLLSGVIGIGVSDTLFFACLNRLGASLTAIVDCSYSPFVIFMATIFLSENLTIFQIFGAFLIITAIITVSYEKNNLSIPRKVLLTGIAFGIASMFAMGVSIIIMKPLLGKTSIMWATLIRTTGGVLFTGAALKAHPKCRSILTGILSRRNWKTMLPASILGGYLSHIAWMGGMKFTQASVASALNQMHTIFIFALGVIFLKEGVSLKKTIALLIAVVGVLLVTLL